MTKGVKLADKNLRGKNIRTAIINMFHMFTKVKENITMMWKKIEDVEKIQSSC